MLGEPTLARELLQQQRLLERLEGTGLSMGEECDEGPRGITGPHLDPGGVTSEAAQRGEAPVAVDEHEAARGGWRGGGHRDEGSQLSRLGERALERREALAGGKAGGGEA